MSMISLNRWKIISGLSRLSLIQDFRSTLVSGRHDVGVTYQEIHLFVEFLKEQYGQGRPDYIEALNDLDGLVEVSYREAIERFLEDEVR